MRHTTDGQRRRILLIRPFSTGMGVSQNPLGAQRLHPLPLGLQLPYTTGVHTLSHLRATPHASPRVGRARRRRAPQGYHATLGSNRLKIGLFTDLRILGGPAAQGGRAGRASADRVTTRGCPRPESRLFGPGIPEVGIGVPGTKPRTSGSGGPETTAAGRGPKPKARGESAATAIGVPT